VDIFSEIKSPARPNETEKTRPIGPLHELVYICAMTKSNSKIIVVKNEHKPFFLYMLLHCVIVNIIILEDTSLFF
jgi:hypothetical protein